MFRNTQKKSKLFKIVQNRSKLTRSQHPQKNDPKKNQNATIDGQNETRSKKVQNVLKEDKNVQNIQKRDQK